jgi:hypothetical protein
MKINEYGHVVNADGSTTNPMRTPFWIGDDNQRVSFDFLLLDDGNVALHSMYGNIALQLGETFLYEIHSKDDVVAAAISLLADASRYLAEAGAGELQIHMDNFITLLEGI